MKKAFFSTVILFSVIFLSTASAYVQSPFFSAQLALADDGSGVQFTLNDRGLQSLSYNGLVFATGGNYSHIVNYVIFKPPDGTEKPYGWVTGALADIGVGAATTIRSSGTDPAYFQHIYRQGQEESFTVKMVWSGPDSRTAKVDIYVTNNDATDTLSKISLEYWLGGSAGSKFFVTPDIAPYNSLWWKVGSRNVNGSPVAFIRGNSWGSVAFFTDNYDNYSNFQDVWSNEYTQTGKTDQGNFLFVLNNFDSPGGVSSNAGSDSIAPGATWHYSLYIRFGLASDSAATLAPEAHASFRNSVPYLVNWTNRGPVGRWFIGDGARNSATNPRSYLWDASIDVFPLTPAKQEVFNAKLLKLTDQIIARMNGMNPKPQGIIVWDLEGDEFSHALTYIGSPNKLPDLAPEMDAVADQMFKKFTDAGYQVGMTLRPSTFQTGTVLPATCAFNSKSSLRDVFIKTDAVYPNRGYECTAENTWTQPGNRQPNHQTVSDDDAVVLVNLREKVSYARNRWGARMFYVDSTVYHGGNSLNHNIFRKLQQEFPDCVFFPENASTNYWGASAVYMDAQPGASVSGTNTPSSVKSIWPGAFSMITPMGVDLADPTIHNNLVKAVRDGNMLFFDAWFGNPKNDQVLQIYREAAAGSSPYPVAGLCSAALNTCATGVFSDTADSATNYLWNCLGANGGNTADCSLPIPPTDNPVNGLCSVNLNICSAGAFSDTADTAENYLWNCQGVNGRATAACSIPKAAPDSTKPTITLTAPLNGANHSGIITITASAADAVVTGQVGSGLAGVRFRLDGVNLGSEDTDYPYNINWDTSGSSNGAHNLDAIARDGAGNTQVSQIVTVAISNLDAPVNIVCTTFNYSTWTACEPSKTQSRYILSRSPLNCSGGVAEALIRNCSYTAPAAGEKTPSASLGTDATAVIVGFCGFTPDSCPSGVFAKIDNTKTSYRWKCVGANGGNTAFCSLPINSAAVSAKLAADKAKAAASQANPPNPPLQGGQTQGGQTQEGQTSPPSKGGVGEVLSFSITNTSLYNKLKGKIILRVESKGEAYYISPKEKIAYYLGRPNDAFQVMRYQGLGITNTDLAKIQIADSQKINSSQTLANKQKGMILLQVESKGEAWYVNPNNGQRYFLNRPADAFNLMRKLGLGINEADYLKMGGK